ncbi:hypothetical protein RUM4293_00428 [Ruegeria atlantica]|uniref:Uncharacterized protein n=2 Tax=Ruegeria atlantica TaxID=81569 RepID=A0A0P1E1C0_9RHOB|nr:hypothetical protein RUM4293_00428 [Ruegeria atlantica]
MTASSPKQTPMQTATNDSFEPGKALKLSAANEGLRLQNQHRIALVRFKPLSQSKPALMDLSREIFAFNNLKIQSPDAHIYY